MNLWQRDKHVTHTNWTLQPINFIGLNWKITETQHVMPEEAGNSITGFSHMGDRTGHFRTGQNSQKP